MKSKEYLSSAGGKGVAEVSAPVVVTEEPAAVQQENQPVLVAKEAGEKEAPRKRRTVSGQTPWNPIVSIYKQVDFHPVRLH